MRNFYLTILCSLIAFNGVILAQCPPPGTPESTNTCPEAEPNCLNIDGYCGTINNNNVQQNFPGCPSNVLNNDEWFAFYAGTTQISIQITPSNCETGGQQGLQGAIYQGCVTSPLSLQCACTENPFILQSASFVVGQIYWIVLDGCAGNVCDYSVEVISGSTVGEPPANPGPVTGPSPVCVGTSSSYTVPPITGATTYQWTINPPLGTLTFNNNNASVNWTTPGTTQICVTSSNVCFNNPTPSCIEVEVSPPPTATLSGSGTICAGGGSVELQVAFTGGDGPWTFVYQLNGVNQAPITTSTNPYTLTVTQVGNYSLSSVSYGSNCNGTVSGSANVAAGTINVTGTVTPEACGNGAGAVNLNVTPSGTYDFDWSNGSMSEDITGLGAGTYTVTVSNSAGCTSIAAFGVPDNIVPINITGITSPNTTCSTNNGSINVTITPNNTYDIDWSNGATTEDLSGLAPGTYTVTVTLGPTCSGTASFTINDQPNNPNITSTTTPSICELMNGDINVSVSGGVTPYSFAWSNGATTEDLNDVLAGTYTVTVTGANGCTDTESITLANNNPTINASGGVNANTTCIGGNGSINLIVAPAAPPGGGMYTFMWSNGATTEDIANLTPGNYSVTVNGGGACTQTATFTVPDQPNNPTATATTTPASCGSANGGVNLSVGGGVPPYTIAWSNGATTEDLTNVVAGTYTVTVTGTNGCTTTGSFTVADVPVNPNITSTTTPSICELVNGDINVSVSGGVGPFTYLWSNGATTEDLNDVLAGTYSITVTGANGCTDTESITLTNNNPTLNVNGGVNANTTCMGGNGSINVTLAPAAPPGGGMYTFIWSNGATTEDIANLTPGSYSVTVNGGGACTQTGTFTVPDQPNNPNPNLTTTPSACNLPNGDINLTVGGGVPPFTFAWSNGATTEDINDVLAGSYSVTVTGANGCTGTGNVNLTNNDPDITINPNIQPNTSCSGGTGSIFITVTPPGSYAVNWSNGTTGYTLTGLDDGSYTVTVDGGGSCTETATFAVPNQPNPPMISLSTMPSICGQSNGSANITPSGGVPPYNFQWSNGSTGSGLSNVPSGSYGVTITGDNGCSTTALVDIQNQDLTININENITPNTTCNANGNGAITINVTPPANYIINWSTGASNTASQSGLEPGTYSVTVSAGGTCEEIQTFTVPDQPNEPSVTATDMPSNCGLPNGSASASASGGVPGYTYEWSNGETSTSINDVLAGSYSVTVTAVNDCTASTTVTIANEQIPIDISPSTVDNTSCLAGNGSISLFVSPPTATINWSNGSTSNSLSDLNPGLYSVTVSAGGNCTTSAIFDIYNSAENSTLDYTVVPSTCGEPNGSIDLTITNGQGPYQVFWSNGWPDEDPFSLPPGNYSVTVTTATGCTTTASINVPNNNSTINLTGTPTAVTSCSTPNGSIQLTVTPPGTYTYAWSNSATTQNLSNIPAGSYTVTVSSGPACSATATYQVTNTATPPNLSTTPTAATCGLTNGAINLTITGGVSPYTILWSNSSTSEDQSNLAGGSTYSVTVTGANGCSATASANVGNTNTSPNVTGTTTDNTSCTVNNGGVNITVSPSGAYTYLWSNASTSEDLSNLAAGTYTVTVSAGGSCTSTASFTVTNNVSSPSIVEQITPAICSEDNGGIDLTVTGAITPYTFLWSNTATTEDISGVLPGNYSVTVTGANGCSSTATYNVANNSSSFSLAATTQPLSSCASINGSINLTITPAGSYDIVWSNGETTEDISNLIPDTYTVTVTASGSCSATASYVVGDVTQSPTLAQSVTSEVCGMSNGAINLTVSGSTLPYDFDWSNAAATEDLSNIAADTYTVTVTGANGCSATTSATVPDNTIAFSINGVTASNTSCDINNGGIDLTVSPAGTYTYQWSTNDTSEDLNGLTGGSYSVTVSAGGTCTDEADFTVGSTTLDPVISSNLTPAVCGESNGAIELSVSGGVSPFTFDWASGQTSEDLANLPPGTYSVEVEGANGCVSTANFTVQNNSIPLSVTGTPLANSSCDNPNGSISITVTPAGTYDFVWSNNETTQNLSNLSPGNYSVTVTEGLTCSAEANFTVGNNTNAPNFSQTVDAAGCGLANGAINLTVSGGSTPYSFNWSGGQTTEDLTGVLPGQYQVTVTGSDGCANTGDFDVPDDVIQIGITSSPVANTACVGGNGGVVLTVLPAGTYDYSWSNNQTTPDLTNLVPGTYSVTVSSGVSCSSTATVVILDQPDEPSITEQVAPSICNAPDGSIDLTISGGVQPYSFEWSNNATSEDLAGLNAGDYNVTVTAANGCTVTGSYNVPSESNTFSFTGTALPNTLCGSGNGSINLTVTPAGTYVFDWSNGQTTEDISGLAPDTYEVTISDGGNCTASHQYVVPNNAPTVGLTGTPTNVLCLGGATGEINLTPSGGVAPYVFDWSPSIAGSPEDPTGLTAGSYDVTVTDASGCEGMASFTVNEPTSATQLICTQSTPVSLPGVADGAATVTISGGVAPYSVDWNPGGQQANVNAGNFVINNLGLGAYSVAVTDANGCPSTCGFNITTNDCITAVGSMGTTQLTTCGDGCITANYSDFGEYLDNNDLLRYVLHTGNGNQIVNGILWSDEPTFCFDDALMNYGTTYYISAVAGDDDGAGNVLLTDACTQVSIGTPVIYYEIPVASIAQPAPLTCVQSQVTVQGSSSLPGATYAWSTQGGTIVGSSTTPSIQVNEAGTYTLTVTRNGCQSTASVQVTDISTVVTASITSSPGEILDCTVSQITLNANVAGTANPSIVWFENGQQVGTGQNYMVQDSGTYIIVVTDPPSGCTSTASITIGDNSDYPAVETDPAPLMNCQDTVVTISGSSPVNGVTFEWVTINGTDTTTVGQGESIQVDTTGTYYLIGTAPNGCQNSEAVQVSGDFTQPLGVNAGPNATLDCYETPLDLTGSSNSSAVTFYWTTSIPGVTISNPTEPVITVDADGIYTLTVTNLGNYCTDSDDVEVFQYENVPQAELIAEDPDCAGDTNGSIELTTDPANGPYNFELNGQDYGQQNFFAPLAPGIYEIVVTDGQGCTWSTEVTIFEQEELVVDLGADILVNLGETATIQAQYNVPSSQLDTLIWTPSELFPCPQMPCDVQEFYPTQQTVVTLTVVDENGCEADDLLTVFVEKDNPVYVPNSFSPNGDGTNDVFMIFSGKEVVNIKKFLVFDRWGETVCEYYDFIPNNPAYGWDGTHRGELMNPAVFAWFAVVEFLDGSEVLLEGDVTLVR